MSEDDERYGVGDEWPYVTTDSPFLGGGFTTTTGSGSISTAPDSPFLGASTTSGSIAPWETAARPLRTMRMPPAVVLLTVGGDDPWSTVDVSDRVARIEVDGNTVTLVLHLKAGACSTFFDEIDEKCVIVVSDPDDYDPEEGES